MIKILSCPKCGNMNLSHFMEVTNIHQIQSKGLGEEQKYEIEKCGVIYIICRKCDNGEHAFLFFKDKIFMWSNYKEMWICPFFRERILFT